MRAKCRLDAEMKAKREAELRALAKLEKDKEERGQADELAGAMYEFFAAVYDGDAPRVNEEIRAELQDVILPFPSPDSIHVVTEFGVVEESAIQNTTIVSAGGPSPWHFDPSEEDEEMHAEMTEDVDEQEDPLMVQPTAQSITVADQIAIHDDETSNDTGEEADVDTDDLDAAEEVGEVEGMQTPTMTMASA